MRNFTLLFVAILTWSSLCSQQQPDYNLEFVSTTGIEWPDSVSNRSYNDVWGWDSPDGRAYAILGCFHGTAIFDVTAPEAPSLVDFVSGPESTWRDFKDHDGYIYVTTDVGAAGVQIIDMRAAPDSVTVATFQPSILVREGVEGPLGNCHNLYIADSLMYLAGCRIGATNSTGVLIFDLSQDPLNPTYLGSTGAQAVYAHDVFVQDSLLYSSDFFEGKANIWNVSDPTQPKIVAGPETSNRGTHNTWASSDNQFLFTTDEISDGTVQSFDISNLDDIVRLDGYVPSATRGLGVIPHNAHYLDGYLVTSFYSDGIKVLDVNRPQNMVEVASFDTYHFRDGGFRGVWGAYPFAASGLIYGSDRSTGLWIFDPTYQRAAYVEGSISTTDGEPLGGIQIDIESQIDQSDFSDGDGTFGLGSTEAGPVRIVFNSDQQAFPQYEQVFIDTVISSGEVLVLDIVLNTLPDIQIDGIVLDEATSDPIVNAPVKAFGMQGEYYGQADEQGRFTLIVPEGDYVVAAGAWGYVHDFVAIEGAPAQEITFSLVEGYRDDFEFDYGWVVDTGEVNRPIDEWARGIPQGARYDSVFANPNQDLELDFGNNAFVTGLANGLNGNLLGTSILQSPSFVGTRFNDPFVNYHLWFYDNGVNPADDTLSVFLGNGEVEVLIETLTESATGWRDRSEVRILDHLTLSDEMYLKLVANDQGEVHIFEAGLDGFSVTEGMTTSTDTQLDYDIVLSPNPTSNHLTIRSTGVISFRLLDLTGQVLIDQKRLNRMHELNLESLTTGMYHLQLTNAAGVSTTRKVVKL